MAFFIKLSSKVIFNFVSSNLHDYGKSFLNKGLNFAIPPKTIQYSDFFKKCYLEKLPAWILLILVKNLSKVNCRDITDTLFKQVFKISDKHLSAEELKALNNLVKNKYFVIQ